VANAIYTVILFLFLLALAVLLGLMVYHLIYKRDWKPIRMFLLFVPIGILIGVCLAWLGGLRAWDLLVGALGGGVGMFITIWRQMADSKYFK
jgi:hypothetical protein